MASRGVRGLGEEDNVTYVNFGAKKRVSSDAETRGSHAPYAAQSTPHSRSDNQPSTQERAFSSSLRAPAAARLDEIVGSSTDSGRLTRGRAYARGGNVVDLEFRVGAIRGLVAGTQNEPFSVVVELPFFTKEDLTELGNTMVESPNFFSRVSAGQFTDEMLDILLGTDSSQYRFHCDCPDSSWVCKHAVAVLDRASARIDADPLELLRLRGLDLRKLNEMVASVNRLHAQTEENLVSEDEIPDYFDEEQAPLDKGAGELADEANLPASPDDCSSFVRAADKNRQRRPHVTGELSTLFWQGREFPTLPTPKRAPAIEDSDPKLLQKAMKAVSHTNVDMLRAVSDIEDLYYLLTNKD